MLFWFDNHQQESELGDELAEGKRPPIIKPSVNITDEQANIVQSDTEAGKSNCAGARVFSHISISPLDIPGQVLEERAFMCQYEANPKRTILQPERIILYDL